jgi:uncharacterized protein (DUF1778 family)
MGTTAERLERRLDFRVSRRTKRVIEKAASASGQSLSDFAVTAMLAKAADVLRAERTIRLTERGHKAFLALLSSHARPNAALRKAAAKYKEFLGG